MLDITAALAQAKRLCEPALDPTLTDQEIIDALTRTAIAATWAASTAYAYGQKVIPTIPMGRISICTHAGTSGTTEPNWLIAPTYVAGRVPIGGWGFTGVDALSVSVFGLADGTVAWCDGGVFAGEIFDIRAAAAECWMVKSRKIATGTAAWTEKRVGDLTIKRGATYDQCLRMAASLRPVRIV